MALGQVGTSPLCTAESPTRETHDDRSRRRPALGALSCPALLFGRFGAEASDFAEQVAGFGVRATCQ